MSLKFTMTLEIEGHTPNPRLAVADHLAQLYRVFVDPENCQLTGHGDTITDEYLESVGSFTFKSWYSKKKKEDDEGEDEGENSSGAPDPIEGSGDCEH